MATRIDNDITLSHQDADEVFKLLTDYATHLTSVARKTKSEAVACHCERQAVQARRITTAIVEGLYSWTDGPTPCYGPPVRVTVEG